MQIASGKHFCFTQYCPSSQHTHMSVQLTHTVNKQNFHSDHQHSFYQAKKNNHWKNKTWNSHVVLWGVISINSGCDCMHLRLDLKHLFMLIFTTGFWSPGGYGLNKKYFLGSMIRLEENKQRRNSLHRWQKWDNVRSLFSYEDIKTKIPKTKREQPHRL